jgi:hypothetical protein
MSKNFPMIRIFYVNLIKIMKILQKKNMEDSIISNKSSGDIMEDFFCVSLNIIVEVLEDMDDELKFEVKKYRNKLQLNFIGIESKTSNMHFFLLYTHH